MWGRFHAQGAAESDASVRLGVRSHVPGTRRDRARADGAGIKKAKPPIETPSAEPAPARRGNPPMGRKGKTGIVESWNGGIMRESGCPIPNIPVFQHSIIPSFFPRGSAHEPPPENVASARDVVGMLDRRRVRA